MRPFFNFSFFVFPVPCFISSSFFYYFLILLFCDIRSHFPSSRLSLFSFSLFFYSFRIFVYYDSLFLLTFHFRSFISSVFLYSFLIYIYCDFFSSFYLLSLFLPSSLSEAPHMKFFATRTHSMKSVSSRQLQQYCWPACSSEPRGRLPAEDIGRTSQIEASVHY